MFGGKRTTISVLGALAIAAFTLSGCANVMSRFKPTSRTVASSYVRPPLYIVTALPSAANPTAALDLVGENDEFGRYCAATSTGTSTPAPGAETPCKCQYRFTTTGGAQTVEEFNTTLVENNYIQCTNNVVSTNNSVTVSLRVTANGMTSNPVSVNLAASGGSLDFSDPKSYHQLLRFQCRKIASIPNPFDSGPELSGDSRNVCHGGTGKVYDPIQSDLAANNFGQNYYTESIGGSLKAWINASASSGTPERYNDYECSTDPKNPKYWADFDVYSVVPELNGSSRIYPGSYADSVNRSVAFLANRNVTPFTVPIHGYYAPFTKTYGQTAANNLSSPIGYAAPMDQAGQCPTNIQIPTGMRWVKLIRYKAEYSPKRLSLNAPQSQSANDEISTGITCVSELTTNDFAKDCVAGGTPPPPPDCNLANAESTGVCGGLAYRMVGSNPTDLVGGDPLCVKVKGLTSPAPFLNPPPAPVPILTPPSNGSGTWVAGSALSWVSTLAGNQFHPNASSSVDGADMWHRIGVLPATTATNRFRLNDPAVGSPFNTNISQSLPRLIKSNAINDFNLVDCFNPKNIEDFIYAVMPADIAANSIPDYYRPFRLAPSAPDSCRQSAANAVSATCAPFRIEYDLLPQIPNEEPGTTPLFPACVLQPIPALGGS